MSNTTSLWHRQRLGVIAVGIVGAVACLLPWMTVYAANSAMWAIAGKEQLQVNQSSLGISSWQGMLTLAMTVVCVVVACLGNRPLPMSPWQFWAVLSAAGIAFVNCLYLLVDMLRAVNQISSAKVQMGQDNPLGLLLGAVMPEIQVSPGVGLWLATFAAAAVAGVALLFVGSAQNPSAITQAPPSADA